MRQLAAVAVLAAGVLSACSGAQGTGSDGGSCPEALCAGVCCGTSQTCIAYACCPNLQACGSRCCASGAVCVSDGGAMTCALLCSTAAQCPASTHCCELTPSGLSVCSAVNGGSQGQQCRCTSGFDCPSGCCVPAVDPNGAPVGPYVCKPNDGFRYDCCNGTQTCAAGGCCAVDLNGSDVCITPCTGDSDCGAARCKHYTLPFKTTCTTDLGCAPPP
jgi:hypothetical protein